MSGVYEALKKHGRMTWICLGESLTMIRQQSRTCINVCSRRSYGDGGFRGLRKGGGCEKKWVGLGRGAG